MSNKGKVSLMAWVWPEERDRVREAVALAGITHSDWVARALLDAVSMQVAAHERKTKRRTKK